MDNLADRKGVRFLKQFEPASETLENDNTEEEEEEEEESDPDEIPAFDDDDETEEADWVVWCQDFWFRGTRTAQGVLGWELDFVFLLKLVVVLHELW